jgi:hypothetical protein
VWKQSHASAASQLGHFLPPRIYIRSQMYNQILSWPLKLYRKPCSQELLNFALSFPQKYHIQAAKYITLENVFDLATGKVVKNYKFIA